MPLQSLHFPLDIRRVALPLMQELALDVDEPVYLMVLSGYKGLLLERVDPPHPVRVTMEIGQRVHLHAGSCPKAILAYLPDEEIDTYIAATGLPRLTPYTTTNPEQLKGELIEIRRLGYAYSEEEYP